MSDLPIQLADLPEPVAAAIKRAAKRLDPDGLNLEWTASVITDELRPVLLGGPLPEIPAREGGSPVAGQRVCVPINWAPPELESPRQKPARYAVIYTWPPGTDLSGTVEIRYRRPRTETKLAREVLALQRRARLAGKTSPYSISTDPEHTL